MRKTKVTPAASPSKPTAKAGRVRKKAPSPSALSPAFRRYMLSRWQKQARAMPPRVSGLAYYQRRREALSVAFAHQWLIVPTGHEKRRANDTFYPFRPGSDFYYLTGSFEPDGVLLFIPRTGKKGGHEIVMLVEPNPGREDETFFTDTNKGELWVGPRLGVQQSAHRFGVDRCAGLRELSALLAPCLRKQAPAPYRLIRDMDAPLEALFGKTSKKQRQQDQALMAALGEMRLRKDAHEIRAMRKACQSTTRGFEDVIERLAVGRSEREVEGVFNLRARVEGNAVGYNTIAAAGAHACVLHWSHNDGPLRQGDLLLLDAGVEGHELYTADVTRTLPISGKFSAAQRQVYELVLQAQAAAFAQVRVGNDFMAPNKAAMRVMAHGLQAMGILKDAEADLAPDRQFYRRYTLHNVSHMLGIDVHDCAQARQQAYRYGKLEAGMILTVEPGLYFQKDDLTVPKAFRGIGVRIEDDVLVTARGMEILSDLPRQTDAVEAWMADVWRRAATKGK